MHSPPPLLVPRQPKFTSPACHHRTCTYCYRPHTRLTELSIAPPQAHRLSRSDGFYKVLHRHRWARKSNPALSWTPAGVIERTGAPPEPQNTAAPQK